MLFGIAGAENFDLAGLGLTEEEPTTWIGLLEAVLEARTKVDPETVSAGMWNALLVFAFVLVPSIQGW
jgi:hypothetical protein